jgi:hypothetical protein
LAPARYAAHDASEETMARFRTVAAVVVALAAKAALAQ